MFLHSNSKHIYIYTRMADILIRPYACFCCLTIIVERNVVGINDYPPSVNVDCRML